MINEEIFCPQCGSKTPNFSFCANCGKSLKYIEFEKPSESSSPEEIIIAALTTSDTSKSRFGGGKPKNIFFTTNYLLEDEGSRIGSLGNTMSLELFP